MKSTMPLVSQQKLSEHQVQRFREKLRRATQRALLMIGVALATLGILGGLNALLHVPSAHACHKPFCR